MPGMSTHARTPAQRAPGLTAAWATLLTMGGTEMTYNIWHATHAGQMHWYLAVLYGVAPVAAAALLSHIVAEYGGGKFLQGITFLVMLAAMSISAYATASVVSPAAGPVFRWVFGLSLDAAALVALRVILDSRSRKNRAATEVQEAREAVQQARSQAQEAAQDRSRLETELESVKAELGAELAAVRAELEAVRLRASARKPKRRSARKPAGITAPASAGISGAEDEDLDAEAAALQLWMADRSIPGSRLGPMVGRTDSWGRGKVREFRQTVPGGQAG